MCTISHLPVCRRCVPFLTFLFAGDVYPISPSCLLEMCTLSHLSVCRICVPYLTFLLQVCTISHLPVCRRCVPYLTFLFAGDVYPISPSCLQEMCTVSCCLQEMCTVFCCLQEVCEEKREEDMVLCVLLLKKRVHYLPVITAVFIISSLFIS